MQRPLNRPLSQAEIARELESLAASDPRVMRRAGDLAPFERERRRLLLQP